MDTNRWEPFAVDWMLSNQTAIAPAKIRVPEVYASKLTIVMSK